MTSTPPSYLTRLGTHSRAVIARWSHAGSVQYHATATRHAATAMLLLLLRVGFRYHATATNPVYATAMLLPTAALRPL